jgi:two-component system KDP operon response regulator KdpE
MSSDKLILVIDDELEIRRFLNSTLTQAGFKVVEEETGRGGIKKLKDEEPNIILLDLGLPDIDGTEVIDKVRSFSNVPIIVLSARGQEADKVKALENGADDYLTKPFSNAELVARINVALRHSELKEKSHKIEINGIGIDFDSGIATLNGKELDLTPKEYKLLSILMKNAGKIITQKQLLNEIWDRYTPENNNYLRIHTQHLRKKLNDDPLKPKYIITETGIGLRFKI